MKEMNDEWLQRPKVRNIEFLTREVHSVTQKRAIAFNLKVMKVAMFSKYSAEI